MVKKFTQSVSIACAMLMLGSAFNAAHAKQDGFVDSVYQWGSWDLGIEPAAGGPIPPANRPVNVKTTNLQFRPNANNTFTSARDNVMSSSGNSPSPLPPSGAPTTPVIAPPGSTPGGGVLPGR